MIYKVIGLRIVGVVGMGIGLGHGFRPARPPGQETFGRPGR
jgi:hypothetical protein